MIFGIYGLPSISCHLDICLCCTCQSANSVFLLRRFLTFFTFFPLFQCILITYTDTCLRPFESDMPNLERESWVPLGRGSSPLCRPASPPIFHLSPLLRTRAIQRPTLTFELLRVLIGCARCCKGDSSLSLSQFTPVLPVALLLWCCAPAPPGLSCGFLSWF